VFHALPAAVMLTEAPRKQVGGASSPAKRSSDFNTAASLAFDRQEIRRRCGRNDRL